MNFIFLITSVIGILGVCMSFGLYQNEYKNHQTFWGWFTIISIALYVITIAD
tara:strand:- start:189 stop:344 length:156 start_codon:yes stop_codon:yes gene_type:complete